jgi:tetratricopeptide (TPR) repeat protein
MTSTMTKTIRIKGWWVAVAFVVVAGLFLTSASLRERIYWKLSEWYSEIYYVVKPPEEAVFVPQEAAVIVKPSLTPTKTSTPVTGVDENEETMTATPEITVAPTMTPTPLPDRVVLEGVTYVDQHGLWNYCAPANLSMALSYWGWQVSREELGPYLKPEPKDRNVMPYEMAEYVLTQTNLGAVERYGGDIELLQRLVAGGFPVLIELGVYNPRSPGSSQILWMGHYNLVVGYDQNVETFYVHDSYLSPTYGYEQLLPLSYDDLTSQWRSFNYIFLVVYDVARQEELYAILGDYLDPNWSYEKAELTALQEIDVLQGEDLFFAWFNKGNSLRLQFDYGPASLAFDEAFAVYAELDTNRRPWRMMWYQTGPYFAYFYSGRYQDVIDLATNTIDGASEPFIEETWYWRGQARLALGDEAGAVEDFRESLKYHPGFAPSVQALGLLGYEP